MGCGVGGFRHFLLAGSVEKMAEYCVGGRIIITLVIDIDVTSPQKPNLTLVSFIMTGVNNGDLRSHVVFVAFYILSFLIADINIITLFHPGSIRVRYYKLYQYFRIVLGRYTNCTCIFISPWFGDTCFRIWSIYKLKRMFSSLVVIFSYRSWSFVYSCIFVLLSSWSIQIVHIALLINI